MGAMIRAGRFLQRSPFAPVVCGGLVALFLALTVDLTAPMPLNLWLARDWAITGKRPGDFLPPGYTALVYVAFRMGDVAILKGLQWLIYLSTVALSWRLARIFQTQLNQPSTFPLWVVSFHPYLLLNVTRVVDNSLAVPLLLATILIVLMPEPRVGVRTVGTGILLGLASLVRPNILPLAVLDGKRGLRRAGELAGVLGIALAMSAAGMWAEGGGVHILPRYGATSFYMGANNHTHEALLAAYNAEASLLPALTDYRQVNAESWRSTSS